MNPERWGEIKRIFEQASDLPPEEQAAFVRHSAGVTSEIESEVMRLLTAHASADANFLEQPVARLSDYLGNLVDQPVLQPETLVAGRFSIVRFLNRGGMGEVYEAWDAELNESVALKTVRQEIASRPGVIERFKREVRHAREISHPNICRVHELFAHDLAPGQRIWLLSMELLSGSTLLERIRSAGPLPPAMAAKLTDQMVSGLSAAHALGLVHRDFKTSNVMLIEGAGGAIRAVITDFGLSLRKLEVAGALEEPGGMGTAAYMAPEQQLRGDVGPLADQYALGVVMCEMLTGSPPQRAAAPAGPVAPRQSPVATGKNAVKLPRHKYPPRWESAICRCLEFEPAKRFPAIRDVSAALRPPSIFGIPATAALLLVMITACGVLFWLRNNDKCRICEVVQLTPDTDESESPSLSRTGHSIVYSSDRADTGNLDIFLQKLPSGRPLRLTRDPARDGNPSISPDGQTVAFRSERQGGGIYLTDALGNQERLIVPRGRNPQISPDGKKLLYWTGDPDASLASGKVFILPIEGGQPQPIAARFEDARYPLWSPDGRAVLFSGCETAEKALPGCSEWWVASVDGSRFVNTRAWERIRASAISFFRPGEGFWYEGGVLFSGGANGIGAGLWTIKLDPLSWQVTGAPRRLLEEEARDLNPSLAGDGTIAYTRLAGAVHLWRIEHASRPGQTLLSKVTEDTQIDTSPSSSSEGRWLTFERGRGSQRSIWIRDNLAPPERLLFKPDLPTQSPIVDDTGTFLAYEQTENGGTSIYVKPLTKPPRRVCQGCSTPTGWFDGNRGFFFRDGLHAVIKMADPHSGRMHVVLGQSGASLSEANWSPATEFMLFVETKGDRKRIFAVHVPRATGVAEGRWVDIPEEGVSPDHPRWSRDGRTIFYVSNRDGFYCIYGQIFSPEKGAPTGPSFAVAHFHNQRASIDNVFPRSFNLSVAGDTLYFDLGEQSSTIWTGSLAKATGRSFLSTR